MTGQYVGERFDTSAVADDGTDKYPNNPVIDPEPFEDDVPEVGAPYPEMSIADVEETEETTPDYYIDNNLNSQTVVDVEPTDELPVIDAPAVPVLTHEAVYSPTPELVTLLKSEDSEHFRAQWKEIQGKFVDDPRSAVQQADALVSEVVDQITRMFAGEHSSLESQWNQGSDVSTEDLRKALQHYRSFFNRLVV